MSRNALPPGSPSERRVPRYPKEPHEDVITQHPISERFHELLREMGELHDKKAKDYGRDEDPLANVRASEEWGMQPWVGVMVRLSDKVRRLQSFAKKGVLENESAYDSLMDIAVYALIAFVLMEQGNQR